MARKPIMSISFTHPFEAISELGDRRNAIIWDTIWSWSVELFSALKQSSYSFSSKVANSMDIKTLSREPPSLIIQGDKFGRVVEYGSPLVPKRPWIEPTTMRLIPRYHTIFNDRIEKEINTLKRRTKTEKGKGGR